MKRMLCLLSIIFYCYAQVGAAQSLSKQQQVFVDKMLAAVTTVNHQIEKSRATLLTLYDHFLQQKPLKAPDKKWLENLSARYKVKSHNFEQAETWQTLLVRVDEVPPSLVLAQAINESAWGQSRFAKLGNNYFGKWCYVKGCGIVPLKRKPGAKHEVKKYPTAVASVEDYMLNLNSNNAYKQFRILRREARQKHNQLSSKQLAKGLTKYSEKGGAYVNLLQGIIARFELANYDSAILSS